MAKFLFAYRGGAGMAQTPAERDKSMAAWGAWFGTLGAAIVDPGAPFGASTSVEKKGTGAAASALGGYSVVTADSLDAAAKLATGCPIVGEGGSVDVYDCIEMNM